MKKYYLFTALAAAALGFSSCSSEDVVGENGNDEPITGNAITFKSSTNATTRASYTGAAAANLLGDKFVVEGTKGATSYSTTVVYDNYNVSYTENTANHTESNTANWEYVGLDANANNATLSGQTNKKQTIKYWDYSAGVYDFVAYSTGSNTLETTASYGDGKVKVSAITPSTINSSAYTIDGNASSLGNCYIADLKTVANDDFGKEVQLTFRNLNSKIRLALYETIPGYSVNGVKFYQSASDATGSTSNAYLYGTDNAFNEKGTMKVYYPNTANVSGYVASDLNKAHVSFTAATDGTSTVKTIAGFTYTKGNENIEKKTDGTEYTGTPFIGRNSTEATFAGTSPYYIPVLPNENGSVLNLKVDYTLVSTDGSGETITVHGATAQVPAAYAQWKSGYAYTYIFKISDKTNGKTNTAKDAVGLYPITFDAVVADTQDNTQETITTVSAPSITTYQKGSLYSAADAYSAAKGTIYVMVEKDGADMPLDANGKLYTIDATNASKATEALVADAATYVSSTTSEGNITGRNGVVLTNVTPTYGKTYVAPDGNTITLSVDKSIASFSPSAGTYAFVYTDEASTTENEYYSLKNVAADGSIAGLYTVVATEATGTAASGTKYYALHGSDYVEQTVASGASVEGYYTLSATAQTGTASAAGVYYEKYTKNNGKYYVKVIKVVD